MKDNMKNLKKYLENLDACTNSIKWAGARRTSKAAWLACSRADWLLWLAARIGIDKNLIILAACDCATSVLHFVPENEERPRKAIETTRAFVAGKTTIEELRAAHAAADAAADAAYYAADAAAHATVAYGAAYYAAKVRVQKQKELVFLVRKRIPWELWKQALQNEGHLK